MDKFTDKILVCSDCGKQWVFSAGEQQYFYDRQLTPTHRCPDCRKARRARITPEKRVYNG
jgi:DNA-directed RNA polymerase subunit RPC12/RpoP